MNRDSYASFYRLIDAAPLPRRADRSGSGTLPTRATRYCEAVTSASAFGWWLSTPMDLSLLWDGSDIFWHYGDQPDWMPLESAQFPHFSAAFDAAAPVFARSCAPPFLTVLPEPGALQLWTGYFARTAPDWSLLVRAPANVPLPGGYVVYEGILETDNWFGPVFANIRFTRTHTPLRFSAANPLVQVQPVPRIAYADATLNNALTIGELAAWKAEDWADYRRDVIDPNDDPDRRIGRYSVAVRQRRKSGCPYAAAARAGNLSVESSPPS